MKLERSHLLVIIYTLFVLLYTLYIAEHRTHFGPRKGNEIWYYLKFALAANYLFFILQGLILRSRNWGILLLLPLAILLATIIIVFILVGLLHLGGGGGTLLDHDKADMILASLLVIGLTLFGIKFLK